MLITCIIENSSSIKLPEVGQTEVLFIQKVVQVQLILHLLLEQDTFLDKLHTGRHNKNF